MELINPIKEMIIKQAGNSGDVSYSAIKSSVSTFEIMGVGIVVSYYWLRNVQKQETEKP